jgi:dihydrofolate reductase
MAQSANGYIADKNDEMAFVSNARSERYHEMVARTGNLVIGSATYEIMAMQNEFEKLPADLKVIIVSNYIHSTISPHHTIVGTPGEAYDLCEKSEFSEMLVGGGAHLNGSFLAEGTVDEIYLDVMPVLLSDGVPLFVHDLPPIKLELLETIPVSESEVQLHYKVLK